jgi:hypothetical protein
MAIQTVAEEEEEEEVVVVVVVVVAGWDHRHLVEAIHFQHQHPLDDQHHGHPRLFKQQPLPLLRRPMALTPPKPPPRRHSVSKTHQQTPTPA